MGTLGLGPKARSQCGGIRLLAGERSRNRQRERAALPQEYRWRTRVQTPMMGGGSGGDTAEFAGVGGKTPGRCRPGTEGMTGLTVEEEMNRAEWEDSQTAEENLRICRCCRCWNAFGVTVDEGASGGSDVKKSESPSQVIRPQPSVERITEYTSKRGKNFGRWTAQSGCPPPAIVATRCHLEPEPNGPVKTSAEIVVVGKESRVAIRGKLTTQGMSNNAKSSPCPELSRGFFVQLAAQRMRTLSGSAQSSIHGTEMIPASPSTRHPAEQKNAFPHGEFLTAWMDCIKILRISSATKISTVVLQNLPTSDQVSLYLFPIRHLDSIQISTQYSSFAAGFVCFVTRAVPKNQSLRLRHGGTVESVLFPRNSLMFRIFVFGSLRQHFT
ncbi:hypothetical protein C8R45DRAFT_1072929 [Mycena sanguinolenta]|nr:hypothetical protein C8R45DRAFT_1072929 [Mycena sanguinolenta]